MQDDQIQKNQKNQIRGKEKLLGWNLVLHRPAKARGRLEPPCSVHGRMASGERRISSLAPWGLAVVHMVLWYT